MTGNLRDRAFAIEKIVKDKYGIVDIDDVADLALEELHRDSNRSDDKIAYYTVWLVVRKYGEMNV